MKIAFVTNVFPVLYNTFTVNEMLQLINKGNDLTAFSLERWARHISNENSLRMIDKVRYFDEFVGNDSKWARLALTHSGKVRRLGLQTYRCVGRLLFGKAGGPPCAPKYQDYLGWSCYSLERIGALLRSNGFDIIHAGYGNRPAEAAMLLSRLTGIPFSFEVHAYDLFVDFPFADEKIREATKIFTISHYNKEYLDKHMGCPPEKITVMRVPFNKSHCDRLTEKPRDPNLVIAVCRLHPIKGLAHAIEAIKLVAERRAGVRFLIIGDGPLEQQLKRKIRELAMERHVTLMGSVGNEVALQMMAQAAVFLLPSVVAPNGDRDGIPTSMIEAMYLGTPVVSTRVSGIPELVDDGTSGFLAEPGDLHGIAERLEALLEDNKLRERMGREARAKVKHGFYGADSADFLLQGWAEVNIGRPSK